jgi:hypothetical protein
LLKEAEVGELQQELIRRGHGRGDREEEEPPTWEVINNLRREATRLLSLSEKPSVLLAKLRKEADRREDPARTRGDSRPTGPDQEKAGPGREEDRRRGITESVSSEESSDAGDQYSTGEKIRACGACEACEAYEARHEACGPQEPARGQLRGEARPAESGAGWAGHHQRKEGGRERRSRSRPRKKEGEFAEEDDGGQEKSSDSDIDERRSTEDEKYDYDVDQQLLEDHCDRADRQPRRADGRQRHWGEYWQVPSAPRRLLGLLRHESQLVRTRGWSAVQDVAYALELGTDHVLRICEQDRQGRFETHGQGVWVRATRHESWVQPPGQGQPKAQKEPSRMPAPHGAPDGEDEEEESWGAA